MEMAMVNKVEIEYVHFNEEEQEHMLQRFQ
jgi:hypothetical protein